MRAANRGSSLRCDRAANLWHRWRDADGDKAFRYGESGFVKPLRGMNRGRGYRDPGCAADRDLGLACIAPVGAKRASDGFGDESGVPGDRVRCGEMRPLELDFHVVGGEEGFLRGGEE